MQELEMRHKTEKVEAVEESAIKQGEDRYRTADWTFFWGNTIIFNED
jgi:hypothetical protein